MSRIKKYDMDAKSCKHSNQEEGWCMECVKRLYADRNSCLRDMRLYEREWWGYFRYVKNFSLLYKHVKRVLGFDELFCLYDPKGFANALNALKIAVFEVEAVDKKKAKQLKKMGEEIERMNETLGFNKLPNLDEDEN